MRIYIENIQDTNTILNTLVKNNFIYKKNKIIKLFTNSGIFYIYNDTTHILKLEIVDKPINKIKKDKLSLILDESEYNLNKRVYQIPFEYYKEVCDVYKFTINKPLNLYLFIEISDITCELYFWIEKIDNNFNNTITEITTFLSSFNFY